MNHSTELERMATDDLAKYRRLAQRYMKNCEEADDMVQDAFLKAHSKLHLFKGNSKLSTWFTRVLINTCLMELRVVKRHIPHLSLDELIAEDVCLKDAIPGDNVDPSRGVDMMKVRKLIEKLPNVQRRTIKLQLESLTYTEIAYVCRTRVPGAKSAARVARIKLRQALTGAAA